MGTVLRGTPRREDGRDLNGPMDSATPLAGARQDLSGLQTEDHHGNGVAQPPHRVANPWGQGHNREPRARASQLPPADPQPRVRRGEAASREGRLRGLICMNGNIPLQFVEEEVTVTSPPYPTRGSVTTRGDPVRSAPVKSRKSPCVRAVACRAGPKCQLAKPGRSGLRERQPRSPFRNSLFIMAHDGLQGGANNWPIRAPSSLLPRARTL